MRQPTSLAFSAMKQGTFKPKPPKAHAVDMTIITTAARLVQATGKLATDPTHKRIMSAHYAPTEKGTEQ